MHSQACSYDLNVAFDVWFSSQIENKNSDTSETKFENKLPEIDSKLKDIFPDENSSRLDPPKAIELNSSLESIVNDSQTINIRPPDPVMKNVLINSPKKRYNKNHISSVNPSEEDNLSDWIYPVPSHLVFDGSWIEVIPMHSYDILPSPSISLISLAHSLSLYIYMYTLGTHESKTRVEMDSSKYLKSGKLFIP